MKKSLYDAILRVNLAGERGARSIYQGQLWALRRRGASADLMATIEEMHDQEAEHITLFEQLGRSHDIRPTILSPLWDVAGWSLGVLTALCGDEETMACTAAVEDVIDQHYQAQIDQLDPEEDGPLYTVLKRCQEDEQAHHATALNHGAEAASPLLWRAIQKATRVAIFLSYRF